jgi:hypothetical protein
VSTFEGINHELGPWLKMTAPRRSRQLDVSTVRPGERLGRSWLLLFGLVPVDYDDVTLVRIEAGRGFLKRSPMLSQSVWEHERTLEAAPGGKKITDRVRFEPRLKLLERPTLAIASALFRHRHRRLLTFFA